jgi:hypothetical protein
MKHVYHKYEYAMRDPKTFKTIEAEFNQVLTSMKLQGRLEGVYEVLAGMMFPVVNLTVVVKPPEGLSGPPSIEFKQTTDTSFFKRDFSTFPEVVSCDAANLNLILVDAVTAAMSKWNEMPADTAEYQDTDGHFCVWLKKMPNGTMFAAYPDRDDYAKFNQLNRPFLTFKGLATSRAERT